MQTREAQNTPTRPGNFVKTRDGTHLYWTQWGPARGPTILFLNSAGMPIQMWDYQMVALAEQGYRCIGVDRRGHGRSDQAASGYDIDTFADDLATLIEVSTSTVSPITSHSMGGSELVRYLSRYGSARVTRIALRSAPRRQFSPENGRQSRRAFPKRFSRLSVDSWRKDYLR